MTENPHEYIRLLDQNGDEVEVRGLTANNGQQGVSYGLWVGAPGGVGYPPNSGSPNPPASGGLAKVTLVSWDLSYSNINNAPVMTIVLNSDRAVSNPIHGFLKSSTSQVVASFQGLYTNLQVGDNSIVLNAENYDINAVTQDMMAELNVEKQRQDPFGTIENTTYTKYVSRPAGRGFSQSFTGRVTETSKMAEFSSPEPLRAGDVVTLTGQWITISSATIKLTPSVNNTGPSKSLSSTTSAPANGSVTYTVTSDTYLTGRITWTGGRALDYTLTMSFSS